MSFEFVHTSIERGARGESGFAIAAITRGLPAALEPALGELSAYDFDPSRAVGADAVDWAHRIVSAGGRSYTVLSRTAPCGSDWSGRPNRIAHHLVLEVDERAPAGPASLLASFAGFHDSPPSPGVRDVGPSLPQGEEPARPANAWAAAGFDPGWAGIVAQTVLDAPGAVCCVVFDGEVDGLPLVRDVMALLPIERRWLVTFSTRFQRLPAGARCQLRLLRRGATGVRAMLAEPGVRVIDVVRGVPAGEGVAARAARDGLTVAPSEPERPSRRVNPVLRPTAMLDDESPHPPQTGALHMSEPEAPTGDLDGTRRARAASAASALAAAAGWSGARADAGEARPATPAVPVRPSAKMRGIVARRRSACSS